MIKSWTFLSVLSLLATVALSSDAPICDGVLEHRIVDFEIDHRGRPLGLGETPFRLPGGVRVIGKRFDLDSGGYRDTILIDSETDTRFEDQNFGDFSSVGDQGNHRKVLAFKGNDTRTATKRNIGFITFRFMETVHQIRYVRFLGFANGSVAAFGARGGRLHKERMQGFSFTPMNWYGISKIRINLRTTQAVARVGYTFCNTNRSPKQCENGQLLLQDGRCSSNVWQPRGSIPILLESSGDLALSGDGLTLVTGDEAKMNDRGEVNAFYWNGTSWQQKGQTLQGASSPTRNPYDAHFGHSVDATRDGKIIVASAREFIENSYSQAYSFNDAKRIWEPYGNEIRESEIAISENGKFLIGGRKEGNGFRAYEFKSGIWKRVGDAIVRSEPGFPRYFGDNLHISVDGSTFAIGYAESNSAFPCGGRVAVYRRIKVPGSPTGYDIKQLGPSLFADREFDQFGSEVALSKDGTILAVEDRSDVHVYKYSWEADDWEPLGEIFTNTTVGGFAGGIALSDDGLTLAISFAYHDGSRGTVVIFKFDETSKKWNQLGQRLEGDLSEIDRARDFDGSGLGFDGVSLSGDGRVVAAFDTQYFGCCDERREVKVWTLSD